MKQKFGKAFVLLPAGIFFIASVFIFSRFEKMPDSTFGLLIGVGIGLMLIPFIQKFKARKAH